MASFEISYNITVQHTEIGYNPGIGEAETFDGIDRSMQPGWSGWLLIDAFKRGKTVHEINVWAKNNAELQARKKMFYIKNYWDTWRLSEIVNQQIANTLFDASVNPCIDSAGKVAQKACNVVKPGSLVVDGCIGEHSISVINSLASNLLFTAINAIRSANYHHRAEITASAKQWLPVWLDRLTPYKSSQTIPFVPYLVPQKT